MPPITNPTSATTTATNPCSPNISEPPAQKPVAMPATMAKPSFRERKIERASRCPNPAWRIRWVSFWRSAAPTGASIELAFSSTSPNARTPPLPRCSRCSGPTPNAIAFTRGTESRRSNARVRCDSR